MTTTESVLKEIIAAELQVPVERVRKGLSFRKELGMDSVAALNILFAAEECFAIEVAAGELETVDELEGIVELVERHRQRPS